MYSRWFCDLTASLPDLFLVRHQLAQGAHFKVTMRARNDCYK